MWKTDKRVRFFTGVGFQLLQAVIVMVFIGTMLDWSWTEPIVTAVTANFTEIAIASAIVIYNLASWWLIITGSKE